MKLSDKAVVLEGGPDAPQGIRIVKKGVDGGPDEIVLTLSYFHAHHLVQQMHEELGCMRYRGDAQAGKSLDPSSLGGG